MPTVKTTLTRPVAPSSSDFTSDDDAMVRFRLDELIVKGTGSDGGFNVAQPTNNSKERTPIPNARHFTRTP